MKTYNGCRVVPNGDAFVTVETAEQGPDGRWPILRELLPAASQKLHNHSPDGFQWGYCGSGPAQLALALLLDASGDASASLDWYQEFKREFVAGWGERWSITDVAILEWLCGKRFGSTLSMVRESFAKTFETEGGAA